MQVIVLAAGGRPGRSPTVKRSTAVTLPLADVSYRRGTAEWGSYPFTAAVRLSPRGTSSSDSYQDAFLTPGISPL